MENIQYTRDSINKQIKAIKENKKKLIQNKIKFNITAKIPDRFTPMRFREITSGLYIQGSTLQKTFLTEEHIKEKKIIKKKIEIKIIIDLNKPEKIKVYLFLANIRNIIKKKLYKKFTPTFYISMPSIKIHYIPNNRNIGIKYEYLNYSEIHNKI